jgi:hypothetical protein
MVAARPHRGRIDAADHPDSLNLQANYPGFKPRYGNIILAQAENFARAMW